MNKKTILILLVIFLVSFPAIFSLFHQGFFLTDDGEWMVIRFSAFHQALRDGQFPVRFLGRLNYDYGYPVANFLYPGFMYLAEIPKILGFGFVNAIKIIFGLSMVGSAIFAYLWLSKLFNKTSAFIGSIFYLYAPYHLFDLYKRGSIGEVLALAIIPFILWQIERRSPDRRQTGFLWITLGFAFLILSHNTLALLFLPIILLYSILRKLFTIYYLLFTIFLGISLSAFFWIPAVFELGFTRFSQTQVSNWQDYFVNVNLIGWGTIVVFVCFLLKYFRFNDLNHFSKLSLMLFVVGAGSIFLSLPQSSFLWSILPVTFVQFPFRFLSIAILSTAFLSAIVLENLDKKKRMIVASIFLIFLLTSVVPYIKPAIFFDKGDSLYATNEATTTVADEYMPKGVKIKPIKHFDQKVEIIEGKGSISNLIYNSKKVQFNTSSGDNVNVRINTIYYPGWKAFVDGKEASIQYNNDFGVMNLSIPKDEHKVEFNFSETPLRLFADILSVLSFFILVTSMRVYKFKH